MPLTLEQIKQAVDAGKTVHWHNEGYVVSKAKGQYYVTFHNGYCTGLDGHTDNELKAFYIKEQL